MKKMLVGLTLMICLLGLSTVTYGNTGKAIITPTEFTYYSSSNYFEPQFYFSNITNNPLTVTITLYDKTGSILTSGFHISNNVSNPNTSPSNASLSFDLAANATCTLKIWLSSSSDNYGYGIIEWTQNSTAICGLIAHGCDWYKNVSGAWTSYALPINNGLPF
jgi:hypothetical protein